MNRFIKACQNLERVKYNQACKPYRINALSPSILNIKATDLLEADHYGYRKTGQIYGTIKNAE